MLERLLEDLANELHSPSSSMSSLLNKAIYVAERAGESNYRLLFEYHLRGMDKAKTTELSKTHPTLLAAFSEDRMKQGEAFYLLGSLATLEKGLKDYKIDVERNVAAFEELRRSNYNVTNNLAPTIIQQQAIASVIGTLRTKESQQEEILFKIRNRISQFVMTLQDSLLKNEIASASPRRRKIFIGHGHSSEWKELKDFLQDRLFLEWDEFNREPTAGLATKERLHEMLENARFAFLLMTAEEEHPDNTLHARENVIHEIGLFQGKLGFRKAIVLLEEGCQEFSNIIGLTQIRFPKGNIRAEFEEIRRVLEREGILETKTA